MVIEDFTEEYPNNWVSNDKFLFNNGVVEFYYRWVINAHTYQPGWDDDWNTRYVIQILVDNDSRHEEHKTDDIMLNDRLYSFFMKEREICHKKLNSDDLQKAISLIDKIRIEPKIKKNKYEKIKAILNGGHFMVF